MPLISSYGVEVVHCDKYFIYTCQIYRKVLAYLIEVYEQEWESLKQIKNTKERKTFAEHLIHNTAKNKAKYPFDEKFYKFPSYLRRSAIADAIGAVESYRSSLKNWEKTYANTKNTKKIAKKPKLQMDRSMTPVFYRTVMYQETKDKTKVQLKLYDNHDWIWVTVSLLPTDVAYLEHYWKDHKSSAPKLERKNKKWFLRFAYEESPEFSEVSLKDRIVCAVDLGINTDAVCSIMDFKGTVLARKFINFASDKDLRNHILNRIKKMQQLQQSPTAKWRYATFLNEQHAIKIANSIVDFAKVHNVHTIVFEYLNMKGKKYGRKAQTLSLWRKNYIQDLVTHKAHRLGIHISRINAIYTSQLAFDGTGKVVRHTDNYSICTFTSGKQYNCDLNASYNIGARYFIREILKSLSESERSELGTKVPETLRRTSCTLDTLRKLHCVA